MSHSPPKVLVVEDEDVLARTLCASLERLGYEPTGAVDTGAAALASIEQRRPDVVLMDVGLPGPADGIATAEQIRRRHDIPVVYVTAYADDATLQRAKTTDPFGYLIKPFDERQLQVALEMALHRHRARTQPEKLVEERAARAALEQEHRWAQFLSNASARLAASLDIKQTLEAITRLAVPELADWTAVHLREDGQTQTVAVHHRDGKEQVVWDLMQQCSPDPDMPHGYVKVMRTGEPELQSAAGDPQVATAVSALCVPLVVRGETTGALTLAMAESGRRYAASDLERALELARRCATALDNARLYQQAQSAIIARDEFLSVAAHELRTPLSALLLTIQVLQRANPWNEDAGLQDRLKTLVRQVETLTELVRRLLDVSRIGIKQLQIVNEETDLAALVRDVTDRFREAAARAHSTLTVRTPPQVVGWWDPIRLQQVLTNLLGNAIKFAPGSPVDITLAASDDGPVVLTIRDGGPGIPKERLPYLFHRFGRGVSVQRYAGLGLGLFLTRQIVEAHGGDVTVDSDAGRGASFTVRLPWRQRVMA